MEGINEAIVRQLKEQKGGKEALPLWNEIWKAYESEGITGVDGLLRRLLNPSDLTE